MICHATGFHAQAYAPMIAELTADFEVWGLDFRGHGTSTSPDNRDFSWARVLDDFFAAIDELGLGSIRVFGHSLGGGIAMLAAKQRPELFHCAWLFEPIIFPIDKPPEESRMVTAARKRRAIFDSREAALGRYASRPPLGTLRADALAAYVGNGFDDLDDGTVQLACLPGDEADTFHAADTRLEEVAGIELRAMIAAGAPAPDGMPSPGAWVSAIAAELPNAETTSYLDLGHLGPFQRPDLVGRDVCRWFKSQ